ncbi:MAG: ABC transporter permease [Bryobacteraceae bacterium]
MRTILQDLSYGLRGLLKNRGFTAVALVTLALGIGATSAIFSVVYAVLLRSLPYRDPARLVAVYEDISQAGFPHNTPAPGNYAAWRAQTGIFQDVAASKGTSYDLTGSGESPEKLDAAAVTQNLFTTLGTKPVLGRTFLREEDRPEGPKVAVISHRLWRRRFGSSPNIIGQQILLDDLKYTVVGVLPPGFSFPNSETDVWTPIAFTPKELAEFGSHYLDVVARLQPGVSIEQANAALMVLRDRLARQNQDVEMVKRFFAELLQYSYTRDSRQGLIVLFAAVGFILLIACANIANLLLSRAGTRQREIAIRRAVGAGRARIVRQLLTESALLAIGGGAFGILLAKWTFVFLKNLVPPDLTASVSITMDWPVVVFSIGVTLLSSFVFGLAPTLQITKMDLNEVLKEGGRGMAGSKRSRLGGALVVGEVALSLMLLAGSALLLRSFANLRGINPGFEADHVLTARLSAPVPKYKDFTKRSALYRAILDRVRALPGVESAAFTSALPLTWEGGTNGFTPEGALVHVDETYEANNRVVTPGYFETMKIPLRRGRFFDERDTQTAEPVAVINETMARKFWPDQDPIGKRFKRAPSKDPSPWVRVVGIVGDVRQMRLNEPPRQEMYFPDLQSENNWMKLRDLVIRTKVDPESLASTIRQAVWSVDRDQPVSDVMSLDDLLDKEVTRWRVEATLLGALALLALTLACVGMYGVLSYLVTQRTPEIGIRLALGANASNVFRNVTGHGMSLVAIGIAIGLTAALGVSRLLASLLFEVNATDPAIYASTAAVFAIIAFAACAIPARRAAKVDPVIALRYE